MALQIRRGPTAQRATTLLQTGEVAWTTDTKKLYVGDGVTTGGVNILANIAGTGFVWNPSTEQLDLAGSTITGINADNVAETNGIVPRLWYRSSLGKTHASEIFTTVAGAAHSGISFSWDDVNQKLSATVSPENPVDVVAAALVAGVNTGISFTYGLTQDAAVSGAGRIDAAVDPEFIQDTVNDLFTAGVHTGITFTYSDSLNALSAAVSMGGNLASNLVLNTFNISGAGNISNTGNMSTSGTITATTGLGANLSLNSYNINGTGNIDIAGNISVGPTNVITTQKITSGTSGLEITATNNIPMSVTGIISGGATGQLYVTIRAEKGTISAPTTTFAGDNLGGIAIAGYNGSSYAGSALISSAWEAGATLSDTIPKSTMTLGVGGGGVILRTATFNSLGVFSTPVLQTTIYSVATTALPSATTVGKGAKAFVSDATVATFASAYTGGGSNNVPVYSDGTNWKIG